MKHGANIYKYAKKIGCEPEDMLDFSSNINAYQKEIQVKLSSSLIQKYADSSYSELKEVVAKRYSIKTEQIALFNGATSAIFALFSSLKAKSVYLYAPLYGEYEKAAVATKKHIYKINRLAENPYIPEDDSIVVFVNPSTPEGYYEEDLAEMMQEWIERDCTIVIDESFLEFEALASMREQINKYKRLYIIQSFSKFYGCAGVRIGAIFAHKKAIKKLQIPLWNISSLDSAFLQERMADETFVEQSLLFQKVQKAELIEILESSKLFDDIVESESNFILTHSLRAEEIFKHLLEHKILVRSCGSFDYLSNEWLRFGVKDVTMHKRLQEALLALA